MSFSKHQLKKLATQLDVRRVQTRERDGKTLSYLAGWFVIAEANRIFGFDGWDREMIHFERLFARKCGESYECGYLARVRVLVRAETTTVLREGTGFGQAVAATVGEAHERSLKAAETDATKRALVTFGGRFGLMLYDKDRRPTPSSVGPRRGEDTPEPHVQGLGRAAASIADDLASPSRARAISEDIGDSAHIAMRAADRKDYRLATSDGSEVLVRSPESFCTGLRQLLNAARDQDEVVRLRWNNDPTLVQLRGLPHLVSAHGRHYVDILDELFVQRLNAMTVAGRGAADEASELTSKAKSPPPRHGLRSTAGSDSVSPGAKHDDEGRQKRNACDQGTSSLTDTEETLPHDGVAQIPREKVIDYANADEKSLSRSQDAFGQRDKAVDLCRPSEATNANDAQAAESNIAQGVSESQVARSLYGPFVPVPTYPVANLRNFLATRKESSVRAEPEFRAQTQDEKSRSVDTGQGATLPPVPTRRSQITGGFSIDKSALLIPSERRLRSKAHLRFVASNPCLVCEAVPSHAHHVTFAQARGLSQKVSDEFTVPLCVLHHNELHASHNEISWWRVHGIEPLSIARKLWSQSCVD